MKQFFGIIVSFFFVISAGADVPDARFFKALHMQESSGRLNPPPGDGGLAHGPLMIHQCVLDDVNETYHTNYTLADVEGNLEVSKDVARKYFARWATEKRLGRVPTYQDFARIWNRGPYGCFDNGTINKNGKKGKNWRKIAEYQRKAVEYWHQLESKL